MLVPTYGLLVEDACGEIYKVMTPVKNTTRLVGVVICRVDRVSMRVVDMPVRIEVSEWKDMQRLKE